MSSENPLLNNDDNEQEHEEDSGASNTQTANASATAEEAEVLIIKDCDPWWETPNEDILTELEVPYRVVDSDQLADETFSSYAAVLLPSTQPQAYYEEIAARQDSLAEYVSGGGVLIAHTMHSGWPCNAGLDLGVTYAPANVETSYTGRRDINTIAQSDHPVVDDLSDNDFDRPEVSYNELTGLPDSARIILESSREEPVYVEYENGDGIVLASGNPMEGAWAVEGHATPKRFLQNELEYALSVDPDSTTVSASVTTLQFIPGKEENPSRDGNPLNSGLMQMFPEDIRWSWGLWGVAADALAEPVFDSWVGGDIRDELPEELEEAHKEVQGKYLDDIGPDESFKQYRFENGLRISFDTDRKGGIISDTLEIQFTEEGSSCNDPRIFRGSRENSETVLHDQDINGIPWEDWYRSNQRTSHRESRYFEYDTDFEFDGEKGVRVVTIWGGWAGFMEDISSRASNDPAAFLSDVWDWDLGSRLLDIALSSAPEEVHHLLEILTTVPRTWTFVDFIVLADGRRYARVWDASPYPSLYTYMDGMLKAKEDMAYEPKQIWNKAMMAFHIRAIHGITPYTFSPIQYDSFLSTENDPWSRYYEQKVEELIDRFDLDEEGWTVDELLPTIPRETLGFDVNGQPVENPDAPFPSNQGINFATPEELPPN